MIHVYFYYTMLILKITISFLNKLWTTPGHDLSFVLEVPECLRFQYLWMTFVWSVLNIFNRDSSNLLHTILSFFGNPFHMSIIMNFTNIHMFEIIICMFKYVYEFPCKTCRLKYFLFLSNYCQFKIDLLRSVHLWMFLYNTVLIETIFNLSVNID